MPDLIDVTTNNHFGDALCLSAALANARLAMPGTVFRYSGNYGEIYHGTEFWRPDEPPRRSVHCEYRDFGVSDKTAKGGSLCDGLTLSLARHLGVDIPAVVRAPCVHVTAPEREWARETLGEGPAILLNSNCQVRSSVKAYPWWSEVCALLPEFRIFLTGGAESRDIRDDSSFPANVTDLRGKTTCRQLLALASVCACAVTPPSSLCHASAAFRTPTVIVSGAREPALLTDYPNALHITSVCLPARHAPRYDRSCGCIHFRTDDLRSCEHSVSIAGRNYAMCMACIDPCAIADAVRRQANPTRSANDRN